MDFIWKSFSALSATELYAILSLRQHVFILEQQSLYGDIDGADQQAQHLLCYEAGELVAYLRLMIDKENLTIGRVAVTKPLRRQKVGSQLLMTALGWIAQRHPNGFITLSAQVDAQAFYTRLGFEVTSLPYDDAGILHVDMSRLGKRVVGDIVEKP